MPDVQKTDYIQSLQYQNIAKEAIDSVLQHIEIQQFNGSRENPRIFSRDRQSLTDLSTDIPLQRINRRGKEILSTAGIDKLVREAHDLLLKRRVRPGHRAMDPVLL